MYYKLVYHSMISLVATRTIVQYNVMYHMYKHFIIITHSVYSQRVQHNYNKDGTSSPWRTSLCSYKQHSPVSTQATVVWWNVVCMVHNCMLGNYKILYPIVNISMGATADPGCQTHTKNSTYMKLAGHSSSFHTISSHTHLWFYQHAT